jgi:Na+-transporting NADH:ubiquinone oxidoreductase subunit D
MANNEKQGRGLNTGFGGGKGRVALRDGVYKVNPITCQVLGICSALAVTSRLEKALVMGGALVFVLAMTGLIVSILRSYMPRRIRMITEVAIIATFVILFDQFLRAFYYDMSKQLGPYVALIITNCIVMGRAEAFATQNPPLLSMLDGVANGLGYAMILAIIAVFREIVGNGTILGYPLLAETGIPKNLLFALAPGAFFTTGFLIWFLNTLNPPESMGD